MEISRLAAAIDQFGARAYKTGRKDLERFFAALGARLAESIFRGTNLDRKAIWLFDLDPETMYAQVKEAMLALESASRAEALDALRSLANEEQRIGKRTPEASDIVRRVLDQVERDLGKKER